MKRAVALCALLLAAGCGLKPIYAGGTSGSAAMTLASVEVAPIADRSGFYLREELVRRLGTPADARYRLEIELDDRILQFGIRGDDSASRERRSLRARYRLIDRANDAVLIDATTGYDVGIDIVQSEYAVVAAENTALERIAAVISDQITTRIALYATQAR